MNNIIERAKTAMADETVSSAALMPLKHELELHFAAVEKRLVDIDDSPGVGIGAVRHALVQEGNAEGLLALSDEMRQLKTEREIGVALLARMRSAESRAQVREAWAGLPQVYKKDLVACLDAESAALEAWRATKGKTDAMVSHARQMRMTCARDALRMSNEGLPGASTETFQRLLNIRGLHRGFEVTNLSSALGIKAS